MSPESLNYSHKIQRFELPGKIEISSKNIRERKKPICLDNIGFLKYRKPNFSYDKIGVNLIKHVGEPLTFSDNHTLTNGDYYLDLILYECSDLNEAISSLKKLAQFVHQNPEIKYLVGSTWLGSVADGRITGRYGFHQTDIPVPQNISNCSQKNGLLKEDMTPMYYKTVNESAVVFIYAPRDQFLSRFHV